MLLQDVVESVIEICVCCRRQHDPTGVLFVSPWRFNYFTNCPRNPMRLRSSYRNGESLKNIT